MGGEVVEVAQGAGWTADDLATSAHEGTRAPRDRLVSQPPLDELAQCFLSLAQHRHVNRFVLQAFAGKQRRMPTAPHHRTVRVGRFDRARDGQGISNRCAGQNTDADQQRALARLDHSLDGIGFEPTIDDHHVDIRPTQRRRDSNERERHRVEHRSWVVEHDSPATVGSHETLRPLDIGVRCGVLTRASRCSRRRANGNAARL